MPVDSVYPLRCTLRDYAWGSVTLLAQLQQRTPTGRPEAELWMGAHPADPSTVTHHNAQIPLNQLIAAHPEHMLGADDNGDDSAELPFLVKLLAAGQPLSIQAHPNAAQAQAGYAAEDQLGIAIDAPHRNYRDKNHKPELLIALTPFAALCGLRDPQDSARSFERLAQIVSAHLEGRMTALVDALDQVRELLDQSRLREAFVTVLQDEPRFSDPQSGWMDLIVAALKDQPHLHQEDLHIETALAVARSFPQDAGVLVSLLMNRVDLSPGQAIQVPAGVLHAYLHGLGLEIMATSDNVLRGGLTGKHVDVNELKKVVDFTPAPIPYCPAIRSQLPGLEVSRLSPSVDEYDVTRYDLSGAESAGFDLDQPGPVILVCTSGIAEVHGHRLEPSESVFIPHAAGPQHVVLQPAETAGHPTTVFVIGRPDPTPPT